MSERKIWHVGDPLYWKDGEEKVDYEVIDEEFADDLPTSYRIEDLGEDAECIEGRYWQTGLDALGWLGYHEITDEESAEKWIAENVWEEDAPRYRKVIHRMLELDRQFGDEARAKAKKQRRN